MLTGSRCRKGDKAILEAAYQKNSKPDKAERLELLKRVNLPTEKAVQVSLPATRPPMPARQTWC
jgi:hypothetical protein